MPCSDGQEGYLPPRPSDAAAWHFVRATASSLPFLARARSPLSLSIALDYRPALLSAAGIGRAARELARALAARRELQLHLFGHCLAPARVPTLVPLHARLHRLPIPGRSLPLLARCGWPAERLAGNARVFHWIDYVHPPVGAAHKVLTVHDLAFVREPAWHGAAAAGLQERTRAAIAAARVVVTPCTATADDVRTFAPGTDVRVVPFGGDHVVATAAAPPQSPPYALFLGTIEPRKNHLQLLAAWQRLPTPRPHLVLIGRRGWACAPIVAAIEAAAQAGWLTWLTNADDAATFWWLQHARLLVYPSLWEGFGFPPLEAMQLGVPVLANRCAPLEELAGDAALLVDATDKDALHDGLRRALGDDDLRQALIARGHERAAQHRWADCAAAYAAIYREVAG